MNDQNLSHLEVTEVVLVYCNIVYNNYQQDSRDLYIFVPNKLFVQLFDISPQKFIFLKSFNSEFSYVQVPFAGLNSKPLGIKVDKVADKSWKSQKLHLGVIDEQLHMKRKI